MKTNNRVTFCDRGSRRGKTSESPRAALGKIHSIKRSEQTEWFERAPLKISFDSVFFKIENEESSLPNSIIAEER